MFKFYLIKTLQFRDDLKLTIKCRKSILILKISVCTTWRIRENKDDIIHYSRSIYLTRRNILVQTVKRIFDLLVAASWLKIRKLWNKIDFRFSKTGKHLRNSFFISQIKKSNMLISRTKTFNISIRTQYDVRIELSTY